MGEPIDISKLSGIKKIIAMACDINADGKLEKTDAFDEISLFNSKCEMFQTNFQKDVSIFTPKYEAARDATYVALPVILESTKKEIPKETATDSKIETCNKMQQKWCKTFKGSPLTPKFFERLYDLLDVLKINIPAEKWNKEEYASPKEQAFDEVIAIFAGEAQLNPKTIGYVTNKKTKQKVPTFYGLFQLSKEGLGAAKQWAIKHPEIAGMNNVKQGMTLAEFKNLKGEAQLDYLIAYIGASRDASKIDESETLTPAKLWSMIKLPNLDEDNPKKKARRERTIIQKQDSIRRIFENNKIPFGKA